MGREMVLATSLRWLRQPGNQLRFPLLRHSVSLLPTEGLSQPLDRVRNPLPRLNLHLLRLLPVAKKQVAIWWRGEMSYFYDLSKWLNQLMMPMLILLKNLLTVNWRMSSLLNGVGAGNNSLLIVNWRMSLFLLPCGEELWSVICYLWICRMWICFASSLTV